MAISWASTRCQPRSVRGLVVGRLPGSGSVLAILEAAAVGVVGGGSSGITFCALLLWHVDGTWRGAVLWLYSCVVAVVVLQW